MSAIEINNLTKKYKDKTAVDSLNLSIERGELFALLGVNGAGKTTTIKMLSCIVKPSTGDAQILGYSINAHPIKVKERINVSPQETAIAPNLSVQENLEFFARLYGYDRKESKRKTEGMMASFGMSEIRQDKARILSGGWQRRLSIAIALISDPQILFLDEPTLGLDVLARRRLWKTIEGLKDRVTMILTTHYLEEAEFLSDRIGILSEGKMKAVGTAKELMAKTSTTGFEDAFIALAGEGVY
jgi:ABC-2 type transport system ATP-binding protein